MELGIRTGGGGAGREGPRTLVERMGEEEVDGGGRRADHQLPGPWNDVTGQ